MRFRRYIAGQGRIEEFVISDADPVAAILDCLKICSPADRIEITLEHYPHLRRKLRRELTAAARQTGYWPRYTVSAPDQIVFRLTP